MKQFMWCHFYSLCYGVSFSRIRIRSGQPIALCRISAFHRVLQGSLMNMDSSRPRGERLSRQVRSLPGVIGTLPADTVFGVCDGGVVSSQPSFWEMMYHVSMMVGELGSCHCTESDQEGLGFNKEDRTIFDETFPSEKISSAIHRTFLRSKVGDTEDRILHKFQ